jgi:hypothetical protein
LLSEPELAPDLAAIALQRLSQRSDGGPLFGPLRSGAALKRDMDLAYSLVIAALCGGIEVVPSRARAGSARTGAADKIGRLFRLRPASRSAEHVRRPALSSPALSVQGLRTLFSSACDWRKPAAIIVAPPWPNTGSSNVFAAQAAAHKRFGHEVLLVLGPLDASSGRQQEITDLEIEMHFDAYRVSYTVGLLIP